jgi:hypothetical protein
MTRHAQMNLLFHGTVILFASMLTGVPLGIAHADGWPPEAIHAWAVTHSSLVSTGILLIAVGAAAHHLAFSSRQARLFSATLLPSVYLLCAGLVVSAVTGQRGLAPTGPVLNVVLHVCNVVGVLGALIAGVLLVRAAYGSVRAHASAPVGGTIGAHGSPARS